MLEECATKPTNPLRFCLAYIIEARFIPIKKCLQDNINHFAHYATDQ